jgi:hypothetical protein
MMLVDLIACLLVLDCASRAQARVLAATPTSETSTPKKDQTAPIIGILSQPLGTVSPNVSYFPASYPKYAAMAGARTVPVLCDTPEAELKALYSKINGLIVPGDTIVIRDRP